jgi:ABC-type Fe3+-hydroxamate transport system substrate-binding protein
MPLSLEALAAHAPDVVLVDATLLRVNLPDLRRRFGAVVPLDSTSLDGLRRSALVLAEVLNTDGARERARRLRDDVDAARRSVAGAIGTRRRVLLLGQSEPLTVLGPGSLLDDAVRACGGENVAADLGRASGPFALEPVRARAPEWIHTTEGPFPSVLRSAWAAVPAVKDGRVADASADDLVRSGPRIPAALRRLGAVLRGELEPSRLTPRRP